MGYAIISLGGKQHRVQEGERLIVDRLPVEPGASFSPTVLFAGGDGEVEVEVTVRVLKHDLGPKIRIGKYKRRTGYKRHKGHRSRVTQIEIQKIAAARAKPARGRGAPKAKDERKVAPGEVPPAEAVEEMTDAEAMPTAEGGADEVPTESVEETGSGA